MGETLRHPSNLRINIHPSKFTAAGTLRSSIRKALGDVDGCPWWFGFELNWMSLKPFKHLLVVNRAGYMVVSMRSKPKNTRFHEPQTFGPCSKRPSCWWMRLLPCRMFQFLRVSHTCGVGMCRVSSLRSGTVPTFAKAALRVKATRCPHPGCFEPAGGMVKAVLCADSQGLPKLPSQQSKLPSQQSKRNL